MPDTDLYPSFADLIQQEREGHDFHRVIAPRGSKLAILAPHGGGIEPGTSELALALAGTDFSLYIFDGIGAGCQRMHITSHRFDDPLCLGLISQAQVAVGLHGSAGELPEALIGGRQACLMSETASALIRAGFLARPAARRILGRDPGNLCNRVLSGAGMQIEISLGLRRSLFAGLDRAGRQHPTPLFDHFIQTVRTVLIQMEAHLCRKSW